MGSYSDAIGSGPVPIWLSDLDLLAPLTQLTHLEVNTLSPQLSGTPIPEVSTQEAEAAYAALSGLTKMEHLELQGFGVSCPTNAESPPVKHTDRFLLVCISPNQTPREIVHCLLSCVCVMSCANW